MLALSLDDAIVVAVITATSVVIVGYLNYRATRAVGLVTKAVSHQVKTPNGHTLGTSSALMEDLLHVNGQRIDAIEIQLREGLHRATAAVDTAARHASEASSQNAVIDTKVDGLRHDHEFLKNQLSQHIDETHAISDFVQTQVEDDPSSEEGTKKEGNKG